MGLWGNFSQWGDADLVTARAAASAPLVESALRELQREARTFQLRALKEAGVAAPKLNPVVDLYPRSRVDTLEVYKRPARDAQKVVESGGSMEEAVEAFEKRLTGIVEADAVVAERDEVSRIQDQLEAEGATDYDVADEVTHDDDDHSDMFDRDEMEEFLRWEDEVARKREEHNPKKSEKGEKIIGWRRVIRPELSQHGTCGLCVVAATQWYTRKNLKAMHHLCKCITLPVTKTSDPGLRWNAEDLRRNLNDIYGAAGGTTSGRKLKRLRVAVREHGELGPMLTYSPKRGWEERKDFVPYEPPDATMQRKRLTKRQSDLKATLAALKHRLTVDADSEGIKHAIGEVEQSLKELSSRLAA